MMSSAHWRVSRLPRTAVHGREDFYRAARWRPLGRRGSSVVETALLIGTAVAGLLALQVYAQRAFQGNLFWGSQGLGLQVDSNDYSESQTLNNMNETTVLQTGAAMLAAQTIQPMSPAYQANSVYNHVDPNIRFSSLPVGAVPREPAQQNSNIIASWGTNQTASYNDTNY